MRRIRTIGLVALAMFVATLPACATRQTACGAGLVEMTGNPDRPYRWTGDLPALECRASSGNKQAQAVMGDVYLFGEMGTAKDIRAAEKWYKRAATAEDGTSLVYVPPVPGQRYGTILQINGGRSQGLNIYAAKQLVQKQDWIGK